MADNYLEKRMEEHRSAQKSTITIYKHKERLSPLNNKRVFVTGGAHGIGEAIVKAFRDEGCRVSFCDKDAKNGNRVSQQYGARFYPVDVTNISALEQCFDDVLAYYGDIDILVNNVGVGNFKPLTETTVDDFDEIISTNLRPAFALSRKLAIHRKAAAYGRIINIASTRAAMSEIGTEGYSASKGAIVSLTHALMMSFAELGVTVNCISPGWIECYNTSAIRDIDRKFHPSQRVGTPVDIARTAVFLSQPGNDFINGQNITVDGGVTRKMIYPEE
jgi:hypothetical protein